MSKIDGFDRPAVDLNRWFNELTQKYLDIVRDAHLHCRESSICEIRTTYHRLHGHLDQLDLTLFSEQLAKYPQADWELEIKRNCLI